MMHFTSSSDQDPQEALQRLPVKTLQYFVVYFLEMPPVKLQHLSVADLIEALIRSDKAHVALDVYEEAKTYIVAYQEAYNFYRWDERMVACESLAIEEIVAYLEHTEYFGLAACVMLMECGEIVISHGMLYAIKKQAA